MRYLWVITNTALLNNVGPRIPIKFALVGSLNTNIGTTIKIMALIILLWKYLFILI